GELDFKVRTRPDGDSYSRAMVHMEEMRERCQLIRQILEKLPTGPVRRKAPIVVPRGEAYGRVESARGECSFYMIGEGGDKPYRARFITGSYRNMAAISEVLKGVRLADMPTSWWRIDYWPEEAVGYIVFAPRDREVKAADTRWITSATGIRPLSHTPH